MARPERALESERVYQGGIFHVRRERVALADGVIAYREIVEHPGAVCIVALDGEGNVVLVRQYRKAVEEELLEVPAGRLEEDESPLECAQRELQEETGLAAGRLEELGAFWTTPGFTTERMYAFLATDLRPQSRPADVDERIEVERLPSAQAMEMARTGHAS